MSTDSIDRAREKAEAVENIFDRIHQDTYAKGRRKGYDEGFVAGFKLGFCGVLAAIGIGFGVAALTGCASQSRPSPRIVDVRIMQPACAYRGECVLV